MKDFEEYGAEAERVVMNYLNEASAFINIHNDAKNNGREFSDKEEMERRYQGLKNAEYDGINNYRNNNIIAIRSKHGDIEIQIQDSILKIDVVRGTWINHAAVDRYFGQFYCIFPHGDISDPLNAKVILASSLQGFKKTCIKNNRKEEYIGAKRGFRYGGMKACVTLKDLVVILNKTVLLGYTIKSKEWWAEVKKPFIKDYLHLKKKEGE